VAAAVALLSACGSGSPPKSAAGGQHTSTSLGQSLEGTTGGTATMVMDEVPTTLNDHTLAGDTAGTRMVASALWPQVFQVGPAGTPVLDTTVVQSAELVSLNPQ